MSTVIFHPTTTSPTDDTSPANTTNLLIKYFSNYQKWRYQYIQTVDLNTFTMSSQIAIADIRQYICGHLQTVFSTMLSLSTMINQESVSHELAGNRITGTVGMAGEKVTGLVYLHLPEQLAGMAATNMLGLAVEDLGEMEINDVIGEVTNMIAGGLKSWLCDAGAKCALTTPAIIRGTAFAITPKPGVQLFQIPFDSSGHQAIVEIHIKFN